LNKSTSNYNVFAINIKNENNLLRQTLILIDGTQLESLIDSGATHNFISSKMVKQLQKETSDAHRNQNITLADGSNSICQGSVKLDFSIQGKLFVEEFIIADLQHTCILGKPWLTKNNPIIDWTENLVKLNEVHLEAQPQQMDIDIKLTNENAGRTETEELFKDAIEIGLVFLKESEMDDMDPRVRELLEEFFLINYRINCLLQENLITKLT